MSASTSASAAHLRVSVTRAVSADPSGPGTGAFVVDVAIDPGWKLFGPGSPDGLPVSVSPAGAGVVVATKVPPGELWGHASIDVTVDPADAPSALEVRYQLCGGGVCLRPQTLVVQVPPVPVVLGTP